MALTESWSFPGAPVATPVGPSVTLGSHREVKPRTLAFRSFQNSPARGTTQSGSSGSSFGDLDGFLPSAKCLSAYQLGVTCFWKVEVCVLLVSPQKPGPQFYTIQLNSGGVTFVLASPRRWVNTLATPQRLRLLEESPLIMGVDGKGVHCWRFFLVPRAMRRKC